MSVFHDVLLRLGLVKDPPPVPFMILVKATTSAQLATLQEAVQAAGATVTSTQALVMLSSGTPLVQQSVIAVPDVVGLFSADVAPVIAALLSDGADSNAIVTFLAGLTPTASPAEALAGGDDSSDDGATGADEDGNPMVDATGEFDAPGGS
jgi:hypothetical protein